MTWRAVLEHGRPWLWHTFLAGTAGGLAMMPVGLAARLLGASVNVYGELLLRTLTGSVHPLLLAVEHLLISWAMAVPLVLALQLVRRRWAMAIGLTYGVGAWLLINSLALPFAFDRPTAWEIGLSAIWGSLLVHLVFGLATALASQRLTRSTSALPEGALCHQQGIDP